MDCVKDGYVYDENKQQLNTDDCWEKRILPSTGMTTMDVTLNSLCSHQCGLLERC